MVLSFTARLTEGRDGKEGDESKAYFYSKEIGADFLFGVFPENSFTKTNLNLSIFHP